MLTVDFFGRSSFASPLMPRSPLGDRDTNLCSWPAQSLMSGKPQNTRPTEPRKREGKFAALTRKKDDRELRRNAYLNKNRFASDEKRHEARAEQNMRLQWLEERRQWEAQKASEEESRTDIDTDLDLDLDLEDPYTEDSSDVTSGLRELLPPSEDDEAFRYFLLSQQEEQDNAALPDLGQPHLSSTDHQPQEFWSDDDEFEQQLLDAAMEIERVPDPSGQQSAAPRTDDMDMMMD